MQASFFNRIFLLATACLCGLVPYASAVDVNGTLKLDNSSSNVLIDILLTGTFADGSSQDSDTSAVSGNITSQFTFDPSGGTPLITGINFTGGRIAADETTVFDIPFVFGTQNLHIEGTGIVGNITTSSPPAPITSQGGANLSYTFSPSNHMATFNEGIVEVSDFQSNTINLADSPIVGTGPMGPNASIQLTQGVTYQNLTQFNAQLTLPIASSAVVPLGDNDHEAAVTTTGTLVANGLFNVDIGLTGSRELIFPGDPVLAIDLDGGSASASPAGEGPENVVDGTAALKHVNLAGSNSGFIVTPVGGSSQVQSMRFTSANDFPERDPATWELYGTNDAIVSMNHSLGTAENWTLIDAGNTDIPDNRLTPGTVVGVINPSSFSSYKVVFPTTKNLNDPVLHLAEAEFFSTTDGTGSDLLNGSSVLAIDKDFVADSSYPGNENPANSIDGDSATKYLNFGNKNSGLIVTPAVGSSVVDGFQITTANDFPLRDPAAWQLYGTNDPVTSADNSLGDSENWTLIDEDIFSDIEVPKTRFTAGDIVSVTNSEAYTSYRIVFTDLRDTNDPFMQIADFQLFGDLASSFTSGDFDQDGDVDGGDFLTWQRGIGTTFDAADLSDWENNYGGGGNPLASASTVPEPGSSTMVLTMSLLLTISSSHRRARSS